MKAEIKNFAIKVMNGVKEHSPEICTGIGIAGMYTAIVLAVKATPKAMKKIEDKKKELGKEKLTVGETIKTAGPCYIGTGIAAVVSTVATVSSTKESLSRNVALTSLLAMREADLQSIKEKTEEIVGPKKSKDIQDAVAKEYVKRYSEGDAECTGHGDVTVIEEFSGRKFKHDPDLIHKAETEMNKELFRSMYFSLNELYGLLGLKPTKAGDMNGWNANEAPVSILFSSQLDEYDRPYLVISYNINPHTDFRDLH